MCKIAIIKKYSSQQRCRAKHQRYTNSSVEPEEHKEKERKQNAHKNQIGSEVRVRMNHENEQKTHF